ncbi:MAG TPA: penicillin acylase family protein, partial [Thermoanaerobaculia bacterium]
SVWTGYRTLDETPHALNPAKGFLASCNNQPVSRDFAYRIPGFYDPYRIVRADALLPTKHTPEEMRAMQLDLTSGLSLRWKALAADGAKKAGLADEARLLNAWNGASTSDSREALLFAAWWRMLPRAVFEDELGADWDTGRVLIDEALTSNTAIDDRRTPQVETLADISARAMKDAKEIAGGRTWGQACKLIVRHPLSRVKVLDWWLHLDRGPVDGTGDPGSLNANFFSYHPETKSFRSRVGPSMRFVLDWSNVDAFTMSGALGQSGNPFSPHYADFLPMMQRGDTWTVPFTKEKVFAAKTSLLRLEP